MGGKRRRSFGGNIRKKKKSAPKQTLARVAERKAEKDDKLQRRIAASEAFSRIPERGGNIYVSTPIEDEASTASVPKEEEEERVSMRQAERRASAYNSLVAGLETSVFKGTARKEKGKPVPAVSRESRISEKESEMVESAVRKSEHTPNEAQQASLEHENARAAARERKHFCSTSSTADLPSKMSSITSIEGVGRVLACVSPDQLETLKEQFGTNFSKVTARSLGLQPSVYAKWQARRSEAGKGDALDKVAQGFLVAMREYHDILLCHKLEPSEEKEIRELYVAHILAHVVRCRARVLRNDSAMKKNADDGDALRDQGFSRARALILVPMKNVAYEVVKMLSGLAVGTEEGQKDVAHVANSERFESEFAPDPSEGDEVINVEEDNYSIGTKPNRKPADYQHIFRGNIDDDFKLGIAVTKKTMKLYSDFYESDIIIASPLGLRRTLAEKLGGDAVSTRNETKGESDDEEWKTGIGTKPKKPKADNTDNGYLSSIEICIVDSANVFSMQNFDSLRKTIAMVNKMPSHTRDTDFSRLREWCLDGLMQNYRQTIITSNYRKPEFLSLFRGFSNHAGQVQLLEVPRSAGTMADVVVNMRQTFFKVPGVASPLESPEKRLAFFFSKTLPMLRSLADSQCLIFIPSYFDYVRVRNNMLEICDEDASFRFASMCEYSKGSDISRARARLFDRTISFVLMTERFHFYWRHWIRGASTIMWYGLPENANFYSEILNMTAEAAESGRPVQTVALYDEFDNSHLERIVGRNRSRKMTAKDSRSTYLFM